MPISVIVPIYIADEEIKKFSKECIDRFYDTLDFNQMIVVDDCSPYNHSIPYTIRNKENLGVAKSWNVGLGLAKNDIILIANSDTMPYRWKDMANRLDEFDVVFPKVYNEKTNQMEIRVAGEFFMFKKELIDKIGNFNEDFGSYFEDTDFFMRVIENGGKLGFDEKSFIYHKSKGTVDRVWDLKKQNEVFDRNLKLYNKLHDKHPYLSNPKEFIFV